MSHGRIVWPTLAGVERQQLYTHRRLGSRLHPQTVLFFLHPSSFIFAVRLGIAQYFLEISQLCCNYDLGPKFFNVSPAAGVTSPTSTSATATTSRSPGLSCLDRVTVSLRSTYLDVIAVIRFVRIIYRYRLVHTLLFVIHSSLVFAID